MNFSAPCIWANFGVLEVPLRKIIYSAYRILFPVRWSELGIAMLSNIFPVAGVGYLIVWGTSSKPWVTKLLFLAMLGLWSRKLSIQELLSTKASGLDWMMAVFFCFALVGYIRSGYPGSTFEYFLALNFVAFFVGRYAIASASSSLIAYFYVIALLVTIAFVLALPEIYNQWNVGGARHPMLYGVVGTASGLDVTLGYLPVLSGVMIIFSTFLYSNVLNYILRACVAISVVLLILIASKSVILATIFTLLIVMVSQYKYWHRSIRLFAVLLCGVVIGVVIAPNNNHKYYGLASPDNWLKAATLPESIASPGLMDDTDTGVIRIKIARDAIIQIVDSPLLGIGARQWDYYSPHPHNVLLESALIFGVPSSFALTFFYMAAIWSLLKIQPCLPDADQTKYAMVAALLLFLLVYNLIQGELASFRSLPLFLLSGYAVGMVAMKKSKDPVNVLLKQNSHNCERA